MDKKYDCAINFQNAEEAIRYFHSESKANDEPVYVATILVRFSAFKSIAVRDAMIEFVKKLFDGMEPFYEGTSKETHMYFYDRTANDSERVNALLDKCVTLNTYFKHYFYPNRDVTFFCIYFGLHGDMDKLTSLCFSNHYDAKSDFLDINEGVRLNSKAGDQMPKARCLGYDQSEQPVYSYDVENKDLARALDKLLKK